jgi:hypothetical protein
VAELEARVADPTCSLDDLHSVITTRTIESIAFVDMVTTRTDPRLDAVAARVKGDACRSASRGTSDGNGTGIRDNR